MKKHLFTLFLVLFFGARFGHAQVLDHFKCYFIPTTPFVNFPVGDTVILQDQFDLAKNVTETVRGLRAVRLCNPVEKTNRRTTTLIANPTHHLMLFLMGPRPIVPRDVVVTNQFGRQVLYVRDARVLAVPTGKTLAGDPPPQIPTGLDHFKCYSASGKRVDDTVTLNDREFSHIETVRVLEPFSFCNPVTKTYVTAAGVPTVTPVVNPLAHLTCYTFVPLTNTAAFVNIINQFIAPVQIEVATADLLCVPSQKIRWSETT